MKIRKLGRMDLSLRTVTPRGIGWRCDEGLPLRAHVRGPALASCPPGTSAASTGEAMPAGSDAIVRPGLCQKQAVAHPTHKPSLCLDGRAQHITQSLCIRRRVACGLHVVDQQCNQARVSNKMGSEVDSPARELPGEGGIRR